MPSPQIIGIVNVTADSFSDGGRYVEHDAALARAALLADGAEMVDLGAESTHPDAADVSAEIEIERLAPLIVALKQDRARRPNAATRRDSPQRGAATGGGVTISIDTTKPLVMRRVIELGADVINDVGGFSSEESIAAVRDSRCRLIAMHSIHSPLDPGGGCGYRARAERLKTDPATIVDRVLAYFQRKSALLESAGIAPERLILDPGMGFFVGDRPESSLALLAGLPRLRSLGRPLCISTSRKSFLGAIVADGDGPRPVDNRGAATLASELWAAEHGADFIRTHDVRALADALRVRARIAEFGRSAND